MNDLSASESHRRVMRVVAVVVAIGIVVAYALLSGLWVSTGSSWYLALEQPAWQPPDAVFGLAWSYNFTALAAVGIVLALRLPPRPLVAYLGLFTISVIAAVLWAWLFYVPHQLVAAAVSLTACALITIGLVVIAWREAWWCGALLLPYQAWLLVASSLSWGYVVG